MDGRKLEILIDFDATCMTHAFPEIGKDIGAVPILKALVSRGHKLILFTMRSGDYLDQAVQWFKNNEIELYGINKNPTQHTWTESPKAYGHLIIDDIGLGMPLTTDERISDRPFVNWFKVGLMLIDMGLIEAKDVTKFSYNEPEEI